MSSRPDSPWHYVYAFYALVRAHGKLHNLIRFVGRSGTLSKSEYDNEVIRKALGDIEEDLNSVRQAIGEEHDEPNPTN
ncbi:hypothetical protein [Nostoc sp.]|uniref:hypothetical protein n=1 Tax=Nostoc sp. TaxID=1180 RepID=UPI002FF505F9